jgi:preprotein translocase subunit SecD
MKAIIYFLLAVFIIGLLPLNKLTAGDYVQIVVQSADASISAADLQRASALMTDRLAEAGMKPVQVDLNGTRQIRITLQSTANLKIAEYLITHKGTIEFRAGEMPVMVQADIDKMVLLKNGGENGLSIQFKPESVGKWAEVTKKNVNRKIAVVMDGIVIYDPLLREPITGGNCVITGNFTAEELQCIAAVGNHGPLPEGFEVVNSNQ